MTVARPAIAVCIAGLFVGGAAIGFGADPPQPAGAVAIGTDQFRHRGWHQRVFFTDGGNTLLVAGEEGVVLFWDVASGRRLDEIAVPRSRFHDATLAAGPNLLAVLGTSWTDEDQVKSERVVWLIEAATRAVARTLRMPDVTYANQYRVRFTPDGKRVVSGIDGQLRVWDVKTGDELIRQNGRGCGDALAVSPDGKAIAFGRGNIFLWRWESGEEPKRFTEVSGYGTEVMQFAPDGKSLHIVQDGGVVSSWDVRTGRQAGSRPLRASPTDMAFSPDGTTLAVPSSPSYSTPEGGHAIDLLDARTWAEVGRVQLGRIGVSHVSWSKDGSRLAGVSDHRAWAWDAKTGKVLGPDRPGHEGSIGALAFGPDGTLFTASDDHTIRSWNSTTGAPSLTLVHDHWVRDVAVSPDGALVAGSALRNDLRVWDAKTGKPRFKLLGNGILGGVRRVRFTADGQRLLAWGDDGFVRVWDARNGKLLAEHSTRPTGKEPDPDDRFGDRMRIMGEMFNAADISPDGSTLVLESKNGVRVLDPMTGKERQKLEAGVTQVAFSPDGRRLLVAGQRKLVQTKLPDGKVRHSVEKDYPVSVWDLAAGKPLWTATVEGSGPALAYSPDGKRVAVVSNVWRGPSRVWVWDAATGTEAGRIELPHRGRCVTFDHTGRRLAVSLDDTTALVYDLATALKAGK